MKRWLVILSPHTPYGPLVVDDANYKNLAAAYREVRQPPNQRTMQRGRGYTLLDIGGAEHTFDLTSIDYIRATEETE